MGTSAEFASFSVEERARAVETVVQSAGGEARVIANISDTSTRRAIEHGLRAIAAGAEAVAATPPYYYPHSQDELLDHYRRIRAAVDLPLFIYNIPQTVRVRVELATATLLASERTVVGIKDSQNDLEWFRQLTAYAVARDIPFSAFAGTRYLIDAGVLAGASGAIPSIANAFPDLAVDSYEAAAGGDFARAGDRERRIMEIEAIPLATLAGSRNAAILGFLKAVLHDRGIIDSPALTAPLRNPGAADRSAWLAQLEGLMSGAARRD
jgi:4-hydroxy-tetrahydrodipicolinate synthase